MVKARRNGEAIAPTKAQLAMLKDAVDAFRYSENTPEEEFHYLRLLVMAAAEVVYGKKPRAVGH